MSLTVVSTATLTPATLLVRGLHIGPLPTPPEPLPPGTHCAITGEPLTAGYPVVSMTTDATAEFLEAFRGGMSGYVSEDAGRCFRSANPRGGNPCARSHLAFADAYYSPLISRESAGEQDRPCWSDLVRAVWPARRGETVLCLLTTDTKKRLWHRSRVGALGARTPVFVHDSATNLSSSLTVDWPALLACLDLLETVYEAGFSKPLLRHGLHGPTGAVAQSAAGTAATRAWELQLREWRGRPEFPVALLIAQRSATYVPPVRPARTQPLTPAPVLPAPPPVQPAVYQERLF